MAHLVDFAHCNNVRHSVQMMEVCKRTHTLPTFRPQARPAGEILVSYPLPPAAYFIPPYQDLASPLFLPVPPADRHFLINNPAWSQLLVPPSLVGLFNRRGPISTSEIEYASVHRPPPPPPPLITRAVFPDAHLSQYVPFQQSFDLSSYSTRPTFEKSPPRAVSVITLSSDSDDDAPPPRVAPPHPNTLNPRSNIKRERLSIDNRNQYGINIPSTSLVVDNYNDPRSQRLLMAGENRRLNVLD